MNPLMETSKRLPSPVSTRLVFWSIAVLCLVNVNHFLNMTIGTGWPATLALAICCAFLCLTVRFPWWRTLGSPGVLLLAALIFYLFIGLCVAPATRVIWFGTDPTFPLRIGLAVLTVLATARGAFVILHQVGVERLLKGMLAVVSVTCLLILATPLLLDYVYTMPRHLTVLKWITQDRFIGTFADPNMAGVVCSYAVVVALSLLGSGQRPWYPGLVLILGTAAGILTFSRATILTLAIVFVLFFRLPSRKSRPQQSSVVKWMIASVTSVIALLATNLEHLPLKITQIKRLMWFTNIDQFSKTRFELWSLALSEIATAPFFGSGLMRFHYLKDAPLCSSLYPCGAHNSYLMLWGEAGIIPLLLFLLAIGSLLWTSLTLPQSSATRAVTGWTVVFALACMGFHGVPYSPWHNFMLGLSCALLTQARRESYGWKSAPRPVPVPVKS